jgi:hypothetical protein
VVYIMSTSSSAAILNVAGSVARSAISVAMIE